MEHVVASRLARLGLDRQILLVTIVPWVVFLVVQITGVDLALIAAIGILLSAPHVLATTGLYLDTGLRTHVHQHRARYFVVPLGVLLISVVAFSLAEGKAFTYLLGGFLLWQTWHFTKQNLGVASFWLKARGLPGLSDIERDMIKASAAIGSIGIVRALDLFPYFDGALQAIGIALIAVGLIGAVTRGPAQRCLLMAVVVLFFAPTIIFSTDLLAFAGVYATAHGAQYYLMVGHAVRTEPKVAIITVLVVLIGAAPLTHLYEAAWTYGMAKGIVAWHFIADARLWKMSDPEIRGYITSRFDFGKGPVTATEVSPSPG